MEEPIVARPRHYTFLLVEQDPDSRSLIHQALAADPDLPHAIEDAPDRAALEDDPGRAPRYDLIMTGLALDGLSGTEVIDRITHRWPDTPIVILTQPHETELAAELLKRIPVADYVLKTEQLLRLLPTIVHTTLEHAAVHRAAREAEERFRRMAENAPDMIFRWSYASGFEYVNPASTHIIGFTPEEHYADPGLGYRSIHEDDIPIYESVFAEIADPQGPRRHCVIRWFHKDGHIVYVEMRQTPIFDERGDLIAIEGIARDISQHVIARERLRELTTRLTHAQEEERRRIARELHDEIGQALTIVKMRLRMVENALAAQDGAALEKIEALRGVVDEALASVRSLSHELRPPLLDELGWEAAISWLCDSVSQRTGLPVAYTHEGEEIGRLPPQVELAAYRVVQEALTNIVRHAKASHASVTSRRIEGGLQLTVEDDGAGFDPDALRRADQPRSGLGLLGMEERAEAVGGHIRIDSAPGRGTRIEITLPAAPHEP